MNAHLLNRHGEGSEIVYRTVMRKELERAEFARRHLTDRGVIANLADQELRNFMKDEIILQNKLFREEERNNAIITELEVIGQLPPTLHDITN